MAHAPNRPLACAAAISLALHAALLALSAPASKAQYPAPAAILARIAEASPQAQPQAPQITTKPLPTRETAKRAPEKPTAAIAETPPSETASLEQQSSAAPAQIETPATADSTSVAQYRQQLIGVAARYKVYPPQAVQNGWEGDVAVRVSIAASGVPRVSVKAGSGHELLDKQALEMFRLAAPQVPLPPALRGQEFGFEVRAVYALKD